MSDSQLRDTAARDTPARDRRAGTKDLLAMGAVLPLGPAGPAAEEGDVLTARGYGHPALDGRTVVRLVPGAIGTAEDLALEYLGFDAAGVVEVGRVTQQSLGFPAWALVNDPGNSRHALAVVKEMERLTRLVPTKPGLAKEGFDDIGDRLDRSVPHFLPTFYEQVARLFVAAESASHASTFFGKARAAEQRHGLPVDEERLRGVFLEFAGAGAVSAKALREYARSLSLRLSVPEAYQQFRVVCLERCAAGLAPYAGMLEDLRRLAKNAGLETGAEERSLLAEIIHTSSMNRAAASFWKSALPSLAAVAAEDLAVRKRLLALLPIAGDEEFDASWLTLLDRCGAVDLLLDGTVPAAGWLSSWAVHRKRGWQGIKRLAPELALVERLADRLAADGTPVRLFDGPNWINSVDLDLLDTCLAHGVPVDDPPAGRNGLDLGRWLHDASEGRRDLVALTAEPRFTALLRTAVERAAERSTSHELDAVVGHPALRTVLAGWLDARADDLAGPFGLPHLHEQLTRLLQFSGFALATNPEALKSITDVPLTPVLARTLRAGVFDELGWPALEEALPELGNVDPQAAARWYGDGDDQWYRMSDAWPALLVQAGAQTAAVGPAGVLDRRPISLPAAINGSGRVLVRYVAGQWLFANGYGDGQQAVWSGRPTEVFRPEGWLNGNVRPYLSLELPDGSRCYGGRPVHAGDTSFAAETRPVASDGISVWVLHHNQWWEYDPESARRGRASVPAFFDSARVGGRGRLLEPGCQLLPLQPGLEGSPFGTKDGLLGWWVRYDPEEGTLTACSVDGSRSPAMPVPAGPTESHGIAREMPAPPMRLPGGAALHPRSAPWGVHGGINLYDADGILLTQVGIGGQGGAHAAGTPLVPPLEYWHALRPRDEKSSAALRAVTDAEAGALLAAVNDGAEPAAAVHQVLPGVTHPALVTGVAGLLKETARHGKRLAVLAERTARGLLESATAPAEPDVLDAFDHVLGDAFQGFATGGRHFHQQHSARPSTTMMDQLRSLPRALTSSPAHTSLDGTSVEWLTFCGSGMVTLALRAASPLTSDTHRAALLEFLETAAAAGTGGDEEAAEDSLAIDPRGRLRIAELRIPGSGTSESRLTGSVQAAGSRRLFITGRVRVEGKDALWSCVEYDPAGVFGAWGDSTLTASQLLGSADDPVWAPAVRELVTLVRERGPLPYRPEQALEFAGQVGISPVMAALLLLGCPGLGVNDGWHLLSADQLKPLGAKDAETRVAMAALNGLSMAERRAFTTPLLPTDPAKVAELWATGFPLEPAARAWIAARGKRRPAPAPLIRRMVAEQDISGSVDEALNPEQLEQLTGRTRQPMSEGTPQPLEPRRLLTGDTLRSLVTSLRWLAYRLPYGDPLRAVLPVTARMLRERLADPGLLLDLGVDHKPDWEAVSPHLREAHGRPAERTADDKDMYELTPVLVLTPGQYRSDRERVWVRPAALLPAAGDPDQVDGDPDHPDLLLLAATAAPSPALGALRALLSPEFVELVTAGGPPGAPQNPLNGAPGLVREASERYGVSEDAAALYLMLLALPDPTDRNQAGWTGWKPARIKAARAELAATDLVVEAKRARAGRSLFLPGGWLEQQGPRLPSESWKTSLFPWDLPGFVVPDRPVPKLFETAWQRVVDGDAPGYEEFQGRGGRGGRR